MERIAVTIAHLQGGRESYLMPERTSQPRAERWAAAERQPGDTVYVYPLTELEKLP